MVTSFHKPTFRDGQGAAAVSHDPLGIPEPISIGRDRLAALDAAFWARPVRGRVVNVDLLRPSLPGAQSNLNSYFSNRRGMLHPPSPG
ncbi:hypothetical protein DFP89_109142 [Paracoccus lutimaris]|uniref:Uncharacterized protein n=1 Tax=Paracoccus lutimaris TaxID=1490030 RepID=A0A368YWK9_9RHOB|nr:hypothetical protein DFP89_109142 [Paracoccus lutimaris]